MTNSARHELSEGTRALLEAARDMAEPSPSARSRVLEALEIELARAERQARACYFPKD